MFEPSTFFIKKLPDVTSVPISTNAEFVVELSRSDVKVIWLRDGKEIKNSEKYTITSEKNVRKLIVNKSMHEDELEYTCVVDEIRTSSKLIVEGNINLNLF